MGSGNKSTRKYSKRHLNKELAQRNKRKFVTKQRQQREGKFQKAVESFKEKTSEEEALREREATVKKGKEDFLKRESESDESSDLEEMEESEEEMMDIEEDLNFPVLDPPNDSESLSEEGSQDGNGDNIDEEIATYKEQLENLKKHDPAFYQYLAKADQKLLNFDVPVEDASALDPVSTEDIRQLSLAQLQQWCKAVKTGIDLDCLRYLITAYGVACRHGKDQDQQQLFRFTNSKVFTHVMTFTLKEGEDIFKRYLGLDKDKSFNKKDLQLATKYIICLFLPDVSFRNHKDTVTQLFRFLSSTCLLLENAYEDRILSFGLRQTRRFLIFLGIISMKMQRHLLRVALNIFSAGKPASRLQAVLLLRELVLKGEDKLKNLALKGISKSFSQSCSDVNQDTMPEIYFMGTCMIEIFGEAPEQAYENAFKNLKNLAGQLREAIITKEKDSWKKVTSWRFVNCLELWARLIASLAEKGDVQQLVYPVAQLLTGTVRFQEQTKLLPMRLRLISAINNLSKMTGVFIPVSSLLLGILSWSELQKNPQINLNEKCPNQALTLQVDDKSLKSGVFQAEIVEQATKLLGQHLAQFSHIVCFPEMSHWTALQLRKFAKSTQYPSYKSGAMQLVTAINEASDQVLARRKSVSFSPRDADKVEQFEVDGKANGKSALEKLCTQ